MMQRCKLSVSLLPLDGAALLLVRTPGRDMSVSWEEQEPEPEPEPEPEVELSCGRTHSDV